MGKPQTEYTLSLGRFSIFMISFDCILIVGGKVFSFLIVFDIETTPVEQSILATI